MRSLFLFFFSTLSFFANAQTLNLFIGTYTGSGSKGIYVYHFNTSTGKADWVSNTDSAANPSYLTISKDSKYVFAVNETHPGNVSSFSFDKQSGKLNFINSQSSGGDDPCYVSVSNDSKWLMVGNYSGGNASALPVDTNGSIGALAQLIQDTGSGANKNRQEKPHVHSAIFSPDEHFLFTPDLGTDKVMIYSFDAASQEPLKPASTPYVTTGNANGPRHLAFHPNNKYAYLIQELSGKVAAYKYNNGKLTPIQSIITHPANYKGTPGSADIHVSPDGKFLYASNRGNENNIAIFSIDQASGKLSFKGYQSTMGKTPRNFIIDPTGNFLLVANQDTDNIVIFKRDKQTGMLQQKGEEIKIPKPVCLKMSN